MSHSKRANDSENNVEYEKRETSHGDPIKGRRASDLDQLNNIISNAISNQNNPNHSGHHNHHGHHKSEIDAQCKFEHGIMMSDLTRASANITDMDDAIKDINKDIIQLRLDVQKNTSDPAKKEELSISIPLLGIIVSLVVSIVISWSDSHTKLTEAATKQDGLIEKVNKMENNVIKALTIASNRPVSANSMNDNSKHLNDHNNVKHTIKDEIDELFNKLVALKYSVKQIEKKLKKYNIESIESKNEHLEKFKILNSKIEKLKSK